MKNVLLLTLMLIGANTFAQTLLNSHVPGVTIKPGVSISANDTTLRVLYVNKTVNPKRPAVYINGRHVNSEFVVDAGLIENINVDADSVQIGNVKYSGQIHITTRNQKIISLTEIKDKYTNLKNVPALFMVDGEIITSDYDEFFVDENFLWRIFVDKVENEDFNLKFIKVLTKSSENFKKMDEIRIRGTELIMKY